MAYQDHFTLADEFIGHADSVITAIDDDFIKSRYIGFIAVAGVTAYELAFKEIIFSFCEKKHKILGTFSRDAYERLNGRIRLSDLRSLHVKRFGVKYLTKFDKGLSEVELTELRASQRSVKASYDNVIQWRHSFAHSGAIPSGPTYEEAKLSYEAGKQVLGCLNLAMVR